MVHKHILNSCHLDSAEGLCQEMFSQSVLYPSTWSSQFHQGARKFTSRQTWAAHFQKVQIHEQLQAEQSSRRSWSDQRLPWWLVCRKHILKMCLIDTFSKQSGRCKNSILQKTKAHHTANYRKFLTGRAAPHRWKDIPGKECIPFCSLEPTVQFQICSSTGKATSSLAQVCL